MGGVKGGPTRSGGSPYVDTKPFIKIPTQFRSPTARHPPPPLAQRWAPGPPHVWLEKGKKETFRKTNLGHSNSNMACGKFGCSCAMAGCPLGTMPGTVFEKGSNTWARCRPVWRGGPGGHQLDSVQSSRLWPQVGPGVCSVSAKNLGVIGVAATPFAAGSKRKPGNPF